MGDEPVPDGEAPQAVPTPPEEAPADDGVQRGIAPVPFGREMGWSGMPARGGFQMMRTPQGEVVVYTIDTPCARLVTFWTPKAMEAHLRAGLSLLGVMPDGLVLATPDDLRGLPPTQP